MIHCCRPTSVFYFYTHHSIVSKEGLTSACSTQSCFHITAVRRRRQWIPSTIGESIDMWENVDCINLYQRQEPDVSRCSRLLFFLFFYQSVCKYVCVFFILLRTVCICGGCKSLDQSWQHVDLVTVSMMMLAFSLKNSCASHSCHTVVKSFYLSPINSLRWVKWFPWLG